MKAVGLLSSGMDSALALKLVLEQGLEAIAVNIVLPFANEKKDYAGHLAEQLGIPLIKVEAGEDYIEIVRNPRYGYGANMNPCIDCRIYMLREAKRVAEQEHAGFVVTGDVLGERPMSQHRDALYIEERDSGLSGLILRPLTAKLLPETIPEREGWIDRSRLRDINGKSRKPQMALARQFGIRGYQTPSSGCLLTNREFSDRLRNLFHRKDRATKRDIELLRIGRHFSLPSSEVIVGRNERENKLLLELKNPQDCVLQVLDYTSPVAILEGTKDREAIEFAARLTARYSDAGPGKVAVACTSDGNSERIIVEAAKPETA